MKSKLPALSQRTAAGAAMPERSPWSALASAWARHPAKAKHRSSANFNGIILGRKGQRGSDLSAVSRPKILGGHGMRRRLIMVCSVLVLALITVFMAPSFLKAQGQ